jgi:hypothetical protein
LVKQNRSLTLANERQEEILLELSSEIIGVLNNTLDKLEDDEKWPAVNSAIAYVLGNIAYIAGPVEAREWIEHVCTQASRYWLPMFQKTKNE